MEGAKAAATRHPGETRGHHIGDPGTPALLKIEHGQAQTIGQTFVGPADALGAGPCRRPLDRWIAGMNGHRPAANSSKAVDGSVSSERSLGILECFGVDKLPHQP